MIFGKYINKYYLKYAWVLLLGVAALVAVDFYQLEIPEIYGTIIDGLDPTTDSVITPEIISSLCLQLLGIVAIMWVGRFLWRVCFFGTAIRVETDLRNKMFDHCKDLSQSFYDVNKVGNIMSLFTEDIETINECFGDGFLMFCDATFLGSLAFYKMVKLNWKLALLTIIPIGLLFAMTSVIRKYIMIKWKTRQERVAELTDFANETFSGMAVIKAFVKEGKELLNFNKVNKKNENANVDFTKLSSLLSVLITLFVQSVICIVLGVGGYLAYLGVFRASQLIMFLSYFNSVIWPVMALSRLIEMSSRGKASLIRISELLDTKIDVKDKKEVVYDVDTIKGKIEFRNLTFRYPLASVDSLTDVSFTIEAGENIGIVGKTGAGKSTIVDLILRTYNVPDGTIFIDDRDVNTLPIKLVRDYSAYVPQDNFLFSDTIASNIAFAYDGKQDISKIEEVSRLADLSDNVKDFPEGYNTLLGERGVTISGGQKQRTSIARALIKNASILILDDSVSAVDTKTEKVILDNLKSSRVGKTTILIAHRITTIEHMDKILFVDDGKIMAFGKHIDLYNNCQEYHNMVELQRLEDEHKEGGGL